MTLEQLQARLQAYLEAETAILKAQEYVIGDGSTARRLRRADLAEVRAEIASLQAQIGAAESTAARGRRVYFIR